MKLGDAVKKVTDAVGIPQCDKCKKRQAELNELGDEVSRRMRERFRARFHRPPTR